MTSLTAQELHVCPGGGHAPVEGAVRDVLRDMELASRAVGVAPVACALVLFESLDVDFVAAPPGRAPAVAAGVKRARPGSVVFTFQGGPDAESTGTGDVLHAAARGEPITVIHLALAGDSPRGKRHAPSPPLAELVAAVEGAAHVERVAVSDQDGLEELRIALRRAFSVQTERKGFSFVEVTTPGWVRRGRRAGCLKEPEAS